MITLKNNNGESLFTIQDDGQLTFNNKEIEKNYQEMLDENKVDDDRQTQSNN